MRLDAPLFLKELILFGLTMILGLVTAVRYLHLVASLPLIQVPTFSLSDIIFIAVVIAFFIVVTRQSKVGRVVLWVFFTLVIWSGIQIITDVLLPFPTSLIISLTIIGLFFLWRRVAMHDLTMIVALAGIAAALGVSISSTLGMIALVALSVYDIIAVYQTRHMVKMAEGMVANGVIFGFIIPMQYPSFFTTHGEARARIGKDFMLLGSGDILLPVIFAASLIRQSLGEAIVVALFAGLGILVTHLLFINQPKRQAMAALPPIATMCLIGYLVALLLKF